ncbi:uncharacterized protein PAC_02578 [Phialocephala subalpina]|uniref:Peptidase M3A/M3B catalytic domain-containing protein n=1 Tax=Phialocephala subalpina TaxID=576137 RepID=A0A1L7WIV6_9HELO|nr:uncharacterized protein PAC_02578 [Phialocephala subalpina]
MHAASRWGSSHHAAARPAVLGWVIRTQRRPFRVSRPLCYSICNAFGTAAISYAKAPRWKVPAKEAKTETPNKKTTVLEQPRPKLKLIGSSDTKAEPVPLQPPPALSEYQKAYQHAKDLTRKYYEAVAAESSELWLTYDEIKGVSGNSMVKFLYPPVKNHNMGRVGFMRQHGTIMVVAATAVRPDTRKRLMVWDENANKDLAASFKKMVVARAKFARLGGFKNFLEHESQFKMIDSKSALAFLESLRTAIAPHMMSYMEDLLEMKMKDMECPVSFATLRHDLRKSGQTIQDFQDFYPEYRLHWGEVSYYSRLKKEKDVWKGQLEKIHEYFPLKSTVCRLLDMFGHVFGLRFSEVLDKHQYDNIISLYLNSSKCGSPLVDREKLPVFNVHDTSMASHSGAYLGVLVLDLVERPGKARNTYCGWFANFPDNVECGEMSAKKTPGYVISAGFNRPTSKMPTTLSHASHAIHNLVRAGNAGVPWDAIEIPSILAEHWVADPRILQKLSSHYTYLDEAYARAWYKSHPGETRPPKEAPLDTFDVIEFSRHPGNRITEIQRGLWMAKFDLTAHSYTEEELQDADLAKDCQDILRDWLGISSAGDLQHHNNSYLNWPALDTYKTSYYCYLLEEVNTFSSEVYSVDIFEKYLDSFCTSGCMVARRTLWMHLRSSWAEN